MILYLTYDWNKGCVCIHTDNGIWHEPARSMHTYLSRRCRIDGTTLEGRKEVFAQMMSARKHIPILTSLREQEMFLPFGNVNAPDTIWINLKAIQHFEKDKEKTLIYLADGSRLNLPYSYTRVKRQIIRSQRYLHSLQ